jgi:LmbE family N-acetylglucosaminyl deacetylase
MTESVHKILPEQVQRVLEALPHLDDESLHTIIVGAQTLLLDRPASSQGTPALLVEVVKGEEQQLLVLYRALAPVARRRMQRALRRVVQVSRTRLRRVQPARLRPTMPPARAAARVAGAAAV